MQQYQQQQHQLLYQFRLPESKLDLSKNGSSVNKNNINSNNTRMADITITRSYPATPITPNTTADNQGLMLQLQNVFRALGDFLSVWLCKSSLPLWMRFWLVLLFLSMFLPFAFLPHAFAITNVASALIVLIVNGREVMQIRGVSKKMALPHLLATIPVIVVDIIALNTNLGSSELVGEEIFSDGDSAYESVRAVVVWYNLVISIVACLFDVQDACLFYARGHTDVYRSAWTEKDMETKLLSSSEEGEAL